MRIAFATFVALVASTLGLASPALAAPRGATTPPPSTPQTVPTATVTATQINSTTGVVVGQSVRTIPETEVAPTVSGGQPTWTFSGSGGPTFLPDVATSAASAYYTDLTVHETNPSNYTYNSEIYWCWNQTDVYNCNDTAGSAAYPYMSTYFTGLADIGERVVSNLKADSRHYLGNSEFYDFSEGHACATFPTTGLCVLNQYPTITITVYADGHYAYSGTAPN